MADERYLVIANETVGGDDLLEEVRKREGESAAFHVVVPAGTEVGRGGDDDQELAAGGGSGPTVGDPRVRDHETVSGTTDTPPGGPASAHEGDLPPADRARIILEHVLGRLERVAKQVTGEVVPTDAVEAAEAAVAGGEYREVILATPPAGGSKLVGQDLPSRVEKVVDVPVTTVIADRTDPRTVE